MFNHLKVPESWNSYFSKYPNGLTIMEALVDWVGQVDLMGDHINDYTLKIDNFLLKFDENLRNEVYILISDWASSGYLQQLLVDIYGSEIKRLDIQLSTKRDKSVLLTQADLSTSSEADKITPNHLSQEVKNMMSGTTPVSPNIADKQITTEKLADEAVNLKKTNFFKLPENLNLFNIKYTTPDKLIGENGGVGEYYAGALLTDYLPIEPNTEYYFGIGYPCAYYDANKNFISFQKFQSSSPVTRTSPANAYYVRWSASANPESSKILCKLSDKGKGLLTYSPETVQFKEIAPIEQQLLKSEEFTRSIDEHVVEKIIDHKTNLFDKNTATFGKIISSNGDISNTEPDKFFTDYIEVIPLEKYWCSIGWSSAYYDEDKKHIGGVNFVASAPTVFTIPEGVKYVRLSGESADTFMFVRGEVKPASYIAFNQRALYTPIAEDTESLKQLVGIASYDLKKWTVVGDSLTEVNATATTRYHDYVAKDLGLTVTNCGLSGSGYMRKQSESKAFYQRVATFPADTEVFTIFGSFNDLGGGFTIGEPTDIGTTTICGCMNETLKVIKTKCPKAKIGIITPTAWNDRTTADTTNSREYVDKLIEVAELHNLPVLDLWRTSGMCPNDTLFKQNFYSKDNGNGVHPDENGHKFFYPLVREFVKTLI